MTVAFMGVLFSHPAAILMPFLVDKGKELPWPER